MNFQKTVHMMLPLEEREAIIGLMRREVVPAIGCTEPIAVALCAARAREVLGEEAYAKYSTPLKQPPLGCDERKAEVEDVTVKAEGDDVAAVEK